MRYVDKKFGFSFEIPDEWRKKRRKLWFLLTGGRVVYQSADGEAHINISVGKLNKLEWKEREIRKAAMENFLERAPARNFYVGEIKELLLNGENNTVAYAHQWYGVYDEVLRGKMISALHDGREYVLQTRNRLSEQHEPEINQIIKSFKF
jgi:hypothetical protein